jgi:hypothetical protein
MRPNARWLAQNGGPPGWLEESDPAGVILYVMDGPRRLPFQYRTSGPDRSCLAACWWNFQLLLYTVVNEINHPSWATSRKEGKAWCSGRTILFSLHLILYKSTLADLWKSIFILAAAVHNNCHTVIPVYAFTCVKVWTAELIVVWVTKGLCSVSFNTLWFTLCKLQSSNVIMIWN